MDLMDLLSLNLESGVFAALFVFSFWFILTENKKREESQRDLYVNLSDSLDKTRDAINTIEGKMEQIDKSHFSVSQDLIEIKYMINNMEKVINSQMGVRGRSSNSDADK